MICLRFVYFALIKSICIVISHSRSEDYRVENNDEVTAVKAGESWTFHCPHLTSPVHRNISVTWLHNAHSLLQITNGKLHLLEEPTSTNLRLVDGRHVIMAVLRGRYIFYYDEVVGDFTLSLQKVNARDAGLWECKVRLYRDGPEFRGFEPGEPELAPAQLFNEVATAQFLEPFGPPANLYPDRDLDFKIENVQSEGAPSPVELEVKVVNGHSFAIRCICSKLHELSLLVSLAVFLWSRHF